MNGVKAVAKVVAATVAAAGMLTATVAGAAFAADFGSFPAPFVQNGAFGGKLVVGANAATADVVGAIGVAAALGQAAWTTSTATGTGTASVSVVSADGVKGDVYQGTTLVGGDLTTDGVITHNKFSALNKWGSGDLKYTDTSTEIKGSQTLEIDSTLATIGHGSDGDARGQWLVALPSGSLRFNTSFTDHYNQSIGKVDLDILGTVVTLQANTNSSLTISSGAKYSVSLDQPTFTDSATGATVTFKGVDANSNNAYVTVTNAGVTDTGVLAKDVEKTIAGVTLKASDLFRMSDTSMFGTVTIGSKLSKTISEGSKWLNADDWILDNVAPDGSGDIVYFDLKYQPSSTMYLADGQSLSGLYGGFEVKNVGPTLTSADYNNGLIVKQETGISVYPNCGASQTSLPVLTLSWPKADSAYIAGSTGLPTYNSGDVNTIHMVTNSTGGLVVTYYSDDADQTPTCYTVVSGGATPATILKLTYGSTNVFFKYGNKTTAGNVVVNVTKTDGTGSEMFNVSVTDGGVSGITQLAQTIAGGSANDPLATDATYGGALIGTNDYDYMTNYGVLITDPKVTLKNGNMQFNVPDDRGKKTVIVGKDKTVQEAIAAGQTGPLSKVTINAISVNGALAASKVPISAPVAALDTEITDADKASTNLVLVGGPSVNSLVKALGGRYADAATYTNVGKLFWVDNAFGGSKTAVVAAGWDADNTRAASYVLAHYDSYASTLAGKTEVTVTGTDVTSLTVN